MALKDDIEDILQRSKELASDIDSTLYEVEDQAKTILDQENRIDELEEENDNLKAELQELKQKYGEE